MHMVLQMLLAQYSTHAKCALAIRAGDCVASIGQLAPPKVGAFVSPAPSKVGAFVSPASDRIHEASLNILQPKAYNHDLAEVGST